MNHLQRDLAGRLRPLALWALTQADDHVLMQDLRGLAVHIDPRGDVRLELHHGGRDRAVAIVETHGSGRALVGLFLAEPITPDGTAHVAQALGQLVSARAVDRAFANPILTPRVGDRSPFGTVTRVDEVEQGVWLVRTASHGGYRLHVDAQAELPPDARLEGGWYEQDLQAMIPAYFLGWARRSDREAETRAALTRSFPHLAPPT